MILDSASTTTGVSYCPAQDHAVSDSGSELRASLGGPDEYDSAASSEPSSRTEEVLRRIQRALKKGQDTEGVLLTPETFGRLCEALAIIPAAVPLPEIVVESERHVGLDWG